MSTQLVPVRRALISVSNKDGLIPLAQKLHALNVTIISTGGTAKAIEQAGIPVTPIDKVTGFPEMMDGRVKTLHPLVHGGLLGLRDNAEHQRAMKEHGITPIDLVCVNLYPFEETVAKPGCSEHDAIENIDIGGPSMIRSAAKNHPFVAVLTDPDQYSQVIADLDMHHGSTSLSLRKTLAAAAFTRTAEYDRAIAFWMQHYAHPHPHPTQPDFPERLVVSGTRVGLLRYGENPHQAAALYSTPVTEANVVDAKQLNGKELSFNNLNDAAAALELIKEFKTPAAAVIKHTNPCGCGIGEKLSVAFERAYAGDPLAAFGGIVALNRTLDSDTAASLLLGQKFLEVIVAPGYEDDALEQLRDRWKNVRILATGPFPTPEQRDPIAADLKAILGGFLLQQRDLADMSPAGWTQHAGKDVTPNDLADLHLAWAVCKHVKSNAIVLARDGAIVGVGAGQMDRVESSKIAIEKANAPSATTTPRSKGAVCASDAFFPFRDGPDLLIAAGIRAIVQPGGSKRDDETIAACRDANIPLFFTGRRHFRH
jgi:phosphoribosylaminoimidazolecarboxamide formyltransferase/IMP cyclohydrolase